MRFPPSPRLLQNGREEREAKLKEFILGGITAHKSGLATPCFTLLARAPDSPVARAVAALASELAAAEIEVRAIMLDLDAFTDEPGRPSLLEMKNADIRVLADLRFTSGHEQLVTGAASFWLGDCMRRDPTKRDAFEVYHHENMTACNHAAVSFGRLWNRAQIVRRVRLAPQAMIAGQMGDEASPQQAPRR